MTWYEKLWGYFNGNKTTIGLVIGFLLSKAWFTDLVGVEVSDILQWVAGTFLAVGVAHKVIKADTTPEPNK